MFGGILFFDDDKAHMVLHLGAFFLSFSTLYVWRTTIVAGGSKMDVQGPPGFFFPQVDHTLGGNL